MPLEKDINKVLIIGSGPNTSGSNSELDILATNAIKAYVQDDVHVVLVNPNPATVQTDPQKGVTVYLEPMTLDFMKRILRMEQPDAIVTAYGSTTALKIAYALKQDGIIEDMNLEFLTISKQALDLNKQGKVINFLHEKKLPTSESWNLDSFDSNNILKNFHDITYPVLVTKYHRYIKNEHFKFSEAHQLATFFEKEINDDHFSIKDYRFTQDLSNLEEVVVSVIRDNRGNFNFINFAASIEPISVNSGDSVLVSPVLTLNNDHIQKLRSISQKVMERLNLKGYLNIHFAVDHTGTQIGVKILSITPALTRSSLIGMRVGMYDLGYVLAKISLGYNLNEIINPLTGLNAAIEPVLDNIAVRAPYWSFTGSGYNHYQLSDQQQASGEAVGVGRNFESAFLKAAFSTIDFNILKQVFLAETKKSKEEILADLKHPNEFHLIYLIAALEVGLTYGELHQVIRLHPIYLQKFQHLIRIGAKLSTQSLNESILLEAKKYGFSNLLIAAISNQTPSYVRQKIDEYNIEPSYITLDGTAGLLHPKVSAVYEAYNAQNEIESFVSGEKVLVIGMKPIQISLNSEFDYMIYHVVKTLKENNIGVILLSNNAEAISTNYKLADRVYFEPITIENIINITKKEGIKKIVTQFAGKEVNSFRSELKKHGLKILGQEKLKFKELDFSKSNLKSVPYLHTKAKQEAIKFAKEAGFPILVGGQNDAIKQKSAVVYDLPALKKYISENELDNINISKFISGKKYEVTAISDGQSCTIPGIIEHLEQSGSHASDSIAVFQPQNLSKVQRKRLKDSTINLVEQMHIKGLINLHYLFVNNKLYCLQVKTYAGHNIAFLSKSLKRDIIQVATQTLLGKKLDELQLNSDIWPTSSLIHVKMPVFAMLNYRSENTFDSKMKSSGSVMGRDTLLSKALYKGYEGSTLKIPSYGTIFISVRDEDKHRVIKLAKRFHRLGFKLVATEGTATILAEAGITTGIVTKVQDDPDNILGKIAAHKIVMVINITNLSDAASQDASAIKDKALNTHIPVFSSLETTKLILEVLESLALTTQPI